MKNLIILLFCLLSFNALSHTTEVEILSAEYGVEDFDQRKTLCLTVVKVPQTGELIGIVESIEDCFYARTAKKSIHGFLSLPLNQFQSIDHPETREHLQRLEPELIFYFSDGE